MRPLKESILDPNLDVTKVASIVEIEQILKKGEWDNDLKGIKIRVKGDTIYIDRDKQYMHECLLHNIALDLKKKGIKKLVYNCPMMLYIDSAGLDNLEIEAVDNIQFENAGLRGLLETTFVNCKFVAKSTSPTDGKIIFKNINVGTRKTTFVGGIILMLNSCIKSLGHTMFDVEKINTQLDAAFCTRSNTQFNFLKRSGICSTAAGWDAFVANPDDWSSSVDDYLSSRKNLFREIFGAAQFNPNKFKRVNIFNASNVGVAVRYVPTDDLSWYGIVLTYDNNPNWKVSTLQNILYSL